MKEQVGTKPEFSPADKSKIVLVSIFLAMLLFILGILLGLLLRQNGVRLSMLFPGRQVMAAVPSTSAAEASVAVTQLEVSGTPGENTIHIVVAISNGGETALMLSPNNVLLTQPDGRPLSLLRIEPRLPRKIGPGATSIFDFTFRRPASETATLKVFTVEHEVEMQAISTAAPAVLVSTPTFPPISVTQEPTLVNPSQLGMLFLKSSASPDQATITFDIKLTNKGANPITLTNDDLSVTPEGGTAAPPTAVTPALPQEIPPGQSLTISVTSPYPNTSSLVLKILDLTMNYSFE